MDLSGKRKSVHEIFLTAMSSFHFAKKRRRGYSGKKIKKFSLFFKAKLYICITVL